MCRLRDKKALVLKQVGVEYMLFMSIDKRHTGAYIRRLDDSHDAIFFWVALLVLGIHVIASDQGPHLLTWFNFNPSMDK